MSEPPKDAKSTPPAAPAAAGKESKESKAAADAPRATRPRRTVRLPAIVFGLLLLLVIAGAAWITWPAWNSALPGWLHNALAPAMEAGRGSAFAGRIESLESRLAAMEAEVRTLRAAPERAGESDAVQRLAQRLEATDRAVAALRDQAQNIGALDSRLAAVEAAIKALAAQSEGAPPSGVDAAALAGLAAEMGKAVAMVRAENQTLAAQLGDVTARLAMIEKRAGEAGEASRESAFVLAVGQLRDAVRAGRPYADALAALRGIAGDDRESVAAIAALEHHAADGVPTAGDLRIRFAAIAPRIAAAAPAPREGWFQRVVDRLGNLVTIRRTGPAAAGGSGPEAAVARAEMALDAGDLAAAVAALEPLSGKARETAADWLASARARLAAESAVASLDALAIKRIGGTKPQGTTGG